ncbi:MAG: efflux RND transporter periplasmic adaptor subunit [Panacagrimonas sp.]
MDDKSALLGSLKIDRGPLEDRSSSPWKWALIATALLLVAAVAWAMLRPDPAIDIQTTTARAAGTATAGSGSVLDASGYVVARRRATVSSKITGKVVELLIEEGTRVEQGQVLARIDDSNIRTQLAYARAQLDSARAALTEVRVALAESERQLRRTSELAQKQLVSQSALDTAQASVDTLRARLESTEKNVTVFDRALAVQAQQLDDTIVRAPFAGVITVKNAQPGEMISPLSAGGDGTRTGIGTLVDMDSLEVEVDVNENFINRVQSGQSAEAVLNAYPDWKIPAEVIAVIPTADRSKATVKVRIRLKVQDARVIPDMGARVSFLTPARTEAHDAAAPLRPLVLVSVNAVQRDNGTAIVFIVRDERTVERRAVTLGGTRGADLEVSAGLVGGERLAVGELAGLVDGMQVRIGKNKE